jgi:flagellar hook protein FlgE
MSINGAMLAGVSGLTANAAALSTISQNIANVNTVGYKRASTEFATAVNAQTQGVGFSAGGVQASARHFISQAGQLQRTTSGTDLAIAGQGFFVVTEKSENLTLSDARLFTRAGAFKIDDLGYLQNTSGLYLQGWPVAADGTVNADPSDMSRLRTINVGSVGGAAEPTTRVSLNANLKSSQAVSDAVKAKIAVEGGSVDPNDIAIAYDPASPTRSMAAYDPVNFPGRGTKPDFEITIPVSDSKGGQRNITVSLLKAEGLPANQWYAEIRAPDGAVTNLNGQLASGRIAFTQDGRLDIDGMKDPAILGVPAEGWLFADPANASLSLGSSDGVTAGLDGAWHPDLGIEAQTITFDLGASTGGLTQYDSTSIVQATYTNGTAFGNLTEVKIDEAGFVTAIFDNGVMRKIAQVALATFPSADSLTEVSGNAFRVSQNSGTFNLKAPGTGGAGLLGAHQLEASTVDLSTEFTGLITTQRAYSASSKIITTADEMLAELINIKR